MSLGDIQNNRMKDTEPMAKRVKTPIRRKKSNGTGAAAMILALAVGAGFFIAIAGFESGAAARSALASTTDSATR